MNNFQLNDTFDNFTFTTSENAVQEEGVGANAPIKLQWVEQQSSNVSFDDSIFLSTTNSFSSFTNTSLNIADFNDTGNTNKSRSTLLQSKLNGSSNLERNTEEISRNHLLKVETVDTLPQPNSTIKLEESNLPSIPKPTAENECPIKEVKSMHPSNDNLKLNDSTINEINTNLSSWGLPDSILQKYDERKITEMFTWQVECLTRPGILNDHKNLVYSAPTSAGKTLVAEILAIKTVLERRKKVIFILPFVSVVREKMFYFQDILGASGVRVEGFMGSYNPPGGFRKVQVAICTIEKANSLVNRLLEDNKVKDIGAVVVDEMHLVGDPSRGYLLELLLTKLQYMSLKDDEVNIQIIGMSATLPNLNLLAEWLDAELYTTDFRPIPLYEQCIVNGEVYNNEFKLQRKLVGIPELETDTDNVLQLCLETIKSSCSVLIFCPTKNWCENLAQQISSAFWKLGSAKTELGNKLRDQLNSEMIAECLEQLKHCPVGLDPILSKTVSFGVAFHHAGLTIDERDIVEGAFRSGSVRVLVATSTLSSGVNLPARRVIIRSPMFNGRAIDTLTYRQMIGRAGRMGKDTEGESILICQKNDYKIAKELMSAHLRPIESCLEGAGKLKRAILEVITSDVASSPDEIELFTKCTLLASDTNREDEISNPIEDSISFLIDNEFIRLQSDNSRYVATSLAKACLSSSLPPEEGLALFTELEKARQCFVLETELHLIYLVTPYSACNQLGNIDWMLYLEMWEKLPASMKRVGELVGVRVSYIISGTRGKIQVNTSKLYHKLQVHKRFYTALALQDLVNEVPLNLVANKFGCNRGMLQSLQQSAATFAGMVTSFSKQLGWSAVEILISQFQDRLQFGISRDLLDLMRLPLLNGQRARILYNAGVETLVDLANTDVYTLENILHKAKPFETEKERDGESAYDADKRNKLRTVWVTGKQGLTEREAAELLVRDARTYLQLELGLREAHWEEEEDQQRNLERVNVCESSVEDVSKSIGSNHSGSHGGNDVIEKVIFSKNVVSVKSPNFGGSSDEEHDVPCETERFKDTKEISHSGYCYKPEENIVRMRGNARRFQRGSNSISSEDDTIPNSDRGKPRRVMRHKDNLPGKSKLVKGYNSISNEEDSPTVAVSNKQTRYQGSKKALLNGKHKKGPKTRTEAILLNANLESDEEHKSSCFSEEDIFSETECELNRNKVLTAAKEQNHRKKEEIDLKDKRISSMNGMRIEQTSPKTSSKCKITTRNSLKQTRNVKEAPLENEKSKAISVEIANDEFELSTSSVHNFSIEERISNNHKTRIKKNANISDGSLFEESFNLDSYILQNISDIEEDGNCCGDTRNENRITMDDFASQFETNFLENISKLEEEIACKNIKYTPPPVVETEDNGNVLNENSTFSPNSISNFSLQFNSELLQDISEIERVNLEPIKETIDETLDLIDTSSGSNEDTTNSRKRSRISITTNKDSDLISIGCSPMKKPKLSRAKPQRSSSLFIDTTYIISTNKTHSDQSVIKEDEEEFVDLTRFEIIDVARNKKLFECFRKELLQQKEIALSLGCEKIEQVKPLIGIQVKKKAETEDFVSKGVKLKGVGVSWGGNTAYYVDLCDTIINKDVKVNLLQGVLEGGDVRVKIFDAKEQIKTLKQCTSVDFNCGCDDPKVADWLLDPEGREKNLQALTVTYAPEAIKLCQMTGNSKGVGSVGLDRHSSIDSRIRSSIEAIVTWHLTNPLKILLCEQEEELLHTYDIEMNCVVILSKMELTGFGVNTKEFQTLSDKIKSYTNAIEAKAYQIAGRRFSFISSTDVARVLGIYRGKKVSTNKKVLHQNETPISSLILLWRRLNSALTKMVYPLLRLVENGRIFGRHITHSSTGRISMQEPNLQNMPRDFEFEHPLSNEKVWLSCRRAFCAKDKNVLVSADYCQLELRLLAHFSQDKILCGIMKSDEDVFKSIAAKWNNISREEVTDLVRQQTKQICYGIIYGMGAKTLADQLCVEEEEAMEFTEAFHKKYPGIKQFISTTISKCKESGYVQTIAGRRRYLPSINDSNSAMKSQAERQAVNTIIQGSAADIVKNVMMLIEKTVKNKFKSSWNKPKMVLHLHDELIYEVPSKYLEIFSKLLKRCMQDTVKLSVPFPVKVKSGQTWGDMKDLLV